MFQECLSGDCTRVVYEQQLDRSMCGEETGRENHAAVDHKCCTLPCCRESQSAGATFCRWRCAPRSLRAAGPATEYRFGHLLYMQYCVRR